MPTNLRFLESRFQELERRELRLHQSAERSRGARRRYGGLSDPQIEAKESLPLTGTEYDARRQPMEPKLQGMREGTAAATRIVQSGFARQVISMKQRATSFFERERMQREANRQLDEDSTFVTSVQLEERLADDSHFAPLFGHPAAGLPPQHDVQQAEEDAGQVEFIEKMMCSDSQLAAAGRHSSASHTEASRLSEATRQSVRPATAASHVVNQRPLAVRVGSAASKRPATSTSRQLDGGRLVEQFFKTLPPVVPPTGVARMTRRVSRPGSAAVADVEPSPPRTVPSPIDVPQFARSADYYHLQVKIVHAAASLAHWEFLVVVSDVTIPDSTPRHQFRGLRVNPHRYLIFQPPDNVVLNPLAQIPWAISPASLYGHTLRIEVFATTPVAVKVVDTMVHYGGHSS